MTQPSSIKQQLQADKISAMKQRQTALVSTLTQVLSAIKQIEIDTRRELGDAEVLAILDKLCKQRQEAIAQAQQANRPERVAQEQQELEWIRQYLPPALSDQEVDQFIQSAIAQTQAQSAKDMGKVMAILKPQLQGRADLTAISQKVKQLLPA